MIILSPTQYCCTVTEIAGLIALHACIDRDYLHWFLKHKRNDFLKKSFGGAQPNISQKLLRKTEIPLPPIPVQRRIIIYLDSLQEKVDELKRLHVETERGIEELIPSILDRAFKGVVKQHTGRVFQQVCALS